MEFKVGDRVKIEGILESNDSSMSYPLKLQLNNGSSMMIFTSKGELFIDSGIVLNLIERPKVKVKKYKVLYEFEESLHISNCYYEDIRHFNNCNKYKKALQLLEATEKEFEE